MNVMTAKTEQPLLTARIERLRELSKTAEAQFRNGEDAAGIENLINAVEELESAVENDQNSQRPEINLNRLLPAVRKLYFYIVNQDITGVADLLGDTIYPMAEKWLKESEVT